MAKVNFGDQDGIFTAENARNMEEDTAGKTVYRPPMESGLSVYGFNKRK